jgi:hypothetical protein
MYGGYIKHFSVERFFQTKPVFDRNILSAETMSPGKNLVGFFRAKKMFGRKDVIGKKNHPANMVHESRGRRHGTI